MVLLMTRGKGAPAEEGEHCVLTALIFSGLSDSKYKELKYNVHNIYLSGVDSLTRSYDAVLRLVDGFKPTAVRQHNGDEKEKGVEFVSPGEVKKYLAELTQSEELATEKK